MRSKGKCRSIMSSLPTTKERFRTHLEPCIGPRFLENVHDLDDRELYRTCRLVCREWAGRYPAIRPEPCNFNFSNGTMRYWTADNWHTVPNKYWVWMLEDVEWWAGRRFQTLSSQELRHKNKEFKGKYLRRLDWTKHAGLKSAGLLRVRCIFCNRPPSLAQACSSLDGAATL